MSTKLATPIRWKIRPPVATLALWAGLMFSPLAMNQARAAMSHTVARLALQSEFTEVRADYWLDIAKAFNLGSIMDRTEAFVEALATLREETFSSYERYMARIELIDDLGETYYDPEIDPADFLSPAAIAASPNPYFPLVPGTIWTYQGETEDGTEVIEVEVTEDTREILGITCMVVRDTVWLDGEVIEDTRDWYTQDTDGNVWYFGELSFEYEDGEIVAMTGSWEAGEDGAIPGITMLATPQAGDVYRQEFLLGEAEDAAEVLATNATASVTFGDYTGICLQTADFTPIEPDLLEHKFYAPGVGFVLETDPESGERIELILKVDP